MTEKEWEPEVSGSNPDSVKFSMLIWNWFKIVPSQFSILSQFVIKSITFQKHDHMLETQTMYASAWHVKAELQIIT